MRLAVFCLLLIPAFLTAAQPVKTIISLSPHTTEMAYAAGLGDKLIAASDYSDYPEAARSLERVANYRGIKMERIVTLQPDLILAWKGGNPTREMTRLEQLGFKVFYSDPKSLEDIASTLEQLGQYADSPKQAQLNANDFRQRLNTLRLAYQKKNTVSYFYQLSNNPMITIAGDNWPSQVFAVCGGSNIFANSAAAYPQISTEQVIVRQPEVIFGTSHAAADPSVWDNWRQQLPAVEKQHIFTVTSDWLNRPTPRTIMAAEEICQYLDQVRQSRL
ncbi:vitamin B12 ABC transporter substrate-binding protein BtuF [Photobacterium sp. DNB23_23_1]|uniref:Vitamin B12-binding protein n=1 Tax=Photobacterium pectinilyticum TaxID=2906793 RepID=A0ABT1N2G1_9GAMM|nr:vitamin B12 ABC transporter substrate-binding protein BtuF [Photobacterium sp. ZSDE20]MCQ1058927.1 vitamin B12 ABC transporter substrate-binding protein BtuF [Photobacterium sp. ZSDE20]MDD1823964.1 vitamin B12 ABC transporter substrate-binding protein BtuF [Photobacterium sp. ZSDE20]